MRDKVYSIRWVLLTFMFVSICCSLVAVLHAAGQQPSRSLAVTIGEINGTARILPEAVARQQRGQAQVLGDMAWRPAAPKTSVNEGDQLQIGENSTLKLYLSDGTAMTLGASTHVSVSQLLRAQGTTPKTLRLHLEKGEITTHPSTKILEQTLQLIETVNGSVEAGSGEVKVVKADQSNILATTSFKKQTDKTEVELFQGAVTVTSVGQGEMITRSLLLPDTCTGQDGVRFILKDPQAQITISRKPDQDSFDVKANRPTEILVATEDNVNEVIFRAVTPAKVDAEGQGLVDLDAGSGVRVRSNELLTLGFHGAEGSFQFGCTEKTSKGLNMLDVYVLYGSANILDTTLAGISNTGRPASSHAPAPSFPPGAATPTPTPTYTPEEEEEEEEEATPTPTPTQGPGEEPTPTQTPVVGPQPPAPPSYPSAPHPLPVTMMDPSTPGYDPTWGTLVISSLGSVSCNSMVNGTVACGNGRCGVNARCVTASFVINSPLGDIVGGGVYVFSGSPTPANQCTNMLNSRYITSAYPGDPMTLSLSGATATVTFCAANLCSATQNYGLRISNNTFTEASPCEQFTNP